MEIKHLPGESRWVVHTDAGEAVLAYSEPRDGVLDLEHTYVPPGAREEGVGEALAREAFRYAREYGYRVIPSCPFVRHWLEEHPEERDMVVA